MVKLDFLNLGVSSVSGFCGLEGIHFTPAEAQICALRPLPVSSVLGVYAKIQHSHPRINSHFLSLSLSQHLFVAQSGLTRRLAVELLDKMNNPDNHSHFSEVDDDDLEVPGCSVHFSAVTSQAAMTSHSTVTSHCSDITSGHDLTLYSDITSGHDLTLYSDITNGRDLALCSDITLQ